MLSKLFKLKYPIILSLIASFSVQADATSNQMIETNLAPSDSSSIFKNLTGSVSFGYGSNFYELEASDNDQEMNLELEISSKYEDWKYGIYSYVTKKLIKEEKAQLGDTKLFFAKPLYLFDKESSFSSSIAGFVTLPTSESSRYDKEMYANFSIGPSLSWNKEKFNLSLLPRIGKVFNKYKTTFKGDANTSYYTKFSLAPAYQISNSLSTRFVTAVTQAWTDNKTSKAPTYSSEMSMALQLETQLYLNVAISNEDKIYKSDGISSNIKIFNNDSSEYSVTLTKEF